MDIAMVTTWPPQACGIAEYSWYLVEGLRGEGHRVTILAEKDRLPLNEQERVFRLWRRGVPYMSPDGLGGLARGILTASRKPDVVHVQHEFGLFPDTKDLMRFAKEMVSNGIGFVLTAHTVLAHRHLFNETPFKKIAHTLDQAVFLSNCTVIPHMVRHEARKDPDLYFLCPGFISESKNHSEILEAWEGIDWELQIIGLCRDERYLDKLEAEIASREVNVVLESRFADRESMSYKYSHAQAIILGGNTSKDPLRAPRSASGQVHQALGHHVPIIAKNVPIYRDGSSFLFDNSAELHRIVKGWKNVDRQAILDRQLFTAGYRDIKSVVEKHLATYHDCR